MTSIGGIDLAALLAVLTAGTVGVKTAQRRRAIRIRHETQRWLDTIQWAKTEEWLRGLIANQTGRDATTVRRAR